MKQDEIIEMTRGLGICELTSKPKQSIHYSLTIHQMEAFAKLVAAKEREKLNRLLWLFQEWKEDHLSQHNYIEAVEEIRARGEA